MKSAVNIFASSGIGHQESGIPSNTHANELGSTLALTDNSGNPVRQYTYSPYGEIINQTGNIDTPYTYIGAHGVYREVYHAAGVAGLYHMKARYYDAGLKRFISRDPIGLDGGVNLYLYANGNPVGFVDPKGLWQFAIGGAYGIGGYITFGQNAGRWNVRLAGGLGFGAFFDYDAEDQPVSVISENLAVELGVEGQAHGNVLGLVEVAGGLRSSIGADEANNYRWNSQALISAQIKETPLNIGGAMNFGLQGNVDKRTMAPYYEQSGPELTFGLGGMVFGGGFANISWNARDRFASRESPVLSNGGPPK